MTWTAEDEEEFAPVDAGEHVLTLPEEHIEGSKGPEGQPLTPEQFETRARGQRVDLDHPEVLEANGIESPGTRSDWLGDLIVAAGAPGHEDRVAGIDRTDLPAEVDYAQQEALDRVARRGQRIAEEAATDPVEFVNAGISGATLGASDSYATTRRGMLRSVGMDVPMESRSDAWRAAHPHATDAAELAGGLVGGAYLPIPGGAPARTAIGRIGQASLAGGGYAGLAALIDDLNHGRTDDAREMAQHVLGSVFGGSLMGGTLGTVGEVPGAVRGALQRRGSGYVDELLGALAPVSFNGRRPDWHAYDSAQRADLVARMEEGGFRPRPWDTAGDMGARLGEQQERIYEANQGLRREAGARGVRAPIDEIADAWERVAQGAEADVDVGGMEAGVPELARRQAEHIGGLPERRALRGAEPLRPDTGRIREAEEALRAAEARLGPSERMADPTDAEMVASRAPDAEPDPSMDAALARLEEAQRAYDALPPRPPAAIDPTPRTTQTPTPEMRREMRRLRDQFDPASYRQWPIERGFVVPPPGLSPEQLRAVRAAREADMMQWYDQARPVEDALNAAREAARPYEAMAPSRRPQAPATGTLVDGPVTEVDAPPTLVDSPPTEVDRIPVGAHTEVPGDDPYRTAVDMEPGASAREEELRPLRERLEQARQQPGLDPMQFEEYLRGIGRRGDWMRAQQEAPERTLAWREAHGRLRDVGDAAVERGLGSDARERFARDRRLTQAAGMGAEAAERAAVAQSRRAPTGLGAMEHGVAGAGIGGAIGEAVGGPAGAAAGAFIGRAAGRTAGRALTARAPAMRAWVSRLARTVADSSAASWASRWAPQLAQAAAAGPDALLAAHLALSQEDPEYAALADEELGPLPEYTGEEMPEDTVAESGSPESDQQGGDEEWLTTVLSAMTPEQREAFARLPLEQQQAVLMQLEESP